MPHVLWTLRRTRGWGGGGKLRQSESGIRRRMRGEDLLALRVTTFGHTILPWIHMVWKATFHRKQWIRRRCTVVPWCR